MALDKYQCKAHAYCMMTNHIHLLLETSEGEIGRFKKCLSERYAMYFNHKYQYRGHLFESRYKSCLVKEDSYFLHKIIKVIFFNITGQIKDYLL